MKILKRTSFWILVVVLSVTSFAVYKRASRSIEVKVEPVARRDLDFTVTATSTGTIKSDMEIKVTAQRAGMISDIYVVEGDIVDDGEMIAELDRSEAELNLRLSQATLDKMKARLSEMRSAIKASRVEVQTAIKSAEAGLTEKEARYGSLKELFDKGYLSQIEFTAAEKEYEVAKADYDAALSGGEKLKAKEDEIKAQEAAVQEAGHKLSLERLNHEYSFINSPASGIVTSMPVKKGETVSKGSLVAVVITTDSLYIEAFVDEADVGRVKLGQEVRVTMDAYPDENFDGRVYKISPVVIGGRLESRTFEVRTRKLVDDVVLKPGMSADTEIVVDRVKDALVIPSQAVVEKEGKKYVYIMKGKKARLREIQVGLSDWTFTQVVSGLKDGAYIVVTPDVPDLNDGTRIKVKE
jgi:multidrug resistance efflux pump